MKEPDLNRALVKSLLAASSDEFPVFAKKTVGTMFSDSWPDIDGFCDRFAFYIEGKLGHYPSNDDTRVLKLSQFSDKQITNLKMLIKLKATVFIAVYLECNPTWTDETTKKKYLYLIPMSDMKLREAVFNDRLTKRVLIDNPHYLVKYKKQFFFPDECLHIIKTGIYMSLNEK